MFCDHLQYLTNGKKEYEFLLDTFCYFIQYPGHKIYYAILIISQFEGIGKSMLEILFKNIFGKYIGSLENTVFDSGFNEFLVDKLLLFVHELKHGNKQQTANNLKSLITQETTRINQKHIRSHDSTNCVNFVFFSNDPEPILITEKDRRYFIVHHNRREKDQKYYDKLIDAFENDFAVLYYFMLKRDIKNYHPKRRPLKTQGHTEVVTNSQTDLFIYLDELRNQLKNTPFLDLVVRSRDISEHIDLHGGQQVKRFGGIKAINRYLQQAGFERRVFSVRVGKKSTSVSLWAQDWGKVKNLKAIMQKFTEKED